MKKAIAKRKPKKQPQPQWQWSAAWDKNACARCGGPRWMHERISGITADHQFVDKKKA